MAQSLESHSGTNARIVVSASNLAVAITNSLTTLLEVASLSGIARLVADFKLTVHDLNAFAIQAKFHPSDAYQTLYSSGFATPSGILVGTSGNLAALVAGSTGWFILDVKGLHSVRVQASSASATGTLCDVYANASS